jgi:hypothetical protein
VLLTIARLINSIKSFETAFSEKTKLNVILGRFSGESHFEIIDLESESTTCQNLSSFPLAAVGHIRGLGFEDRAKLVAT